MFVAVDLAPPCDCCLLRYMIDFVLMRQVRKDNPTRTRKVKRMIDHEFIQSHERVRQENLALSKGERKKQGFLF